MKFNRDVVSIIHFNYNKITGITADFKFTTQYKEGL